MSGGDGGGHLVARESFEEQAMRVFGKPFGQLRRGDQRMIMRVAEARAKEAIEERVALARQAALDTALDAHEQLERMEQLENESLEILNMLARDVKEMMQSDDVDPSPVVHGKTESGTVKRNLRAVEKLMKIKKDHVDTLVSKARLAEQKFTIVQNNDNRKQEALVVTPDSVKDRLGRFKGLSGGGAGGELDS